VKLAFDPIAHAYRLNGAIVPSVTQALQIMETFSYGRGGFDGVLFERARTFGTHVHAATDFFDKGILNEKTLDEGLQGPLLSWKNFLSDTGFQVTHSEQQVFHPLMKYAGTLDRRGFWKRTTWCLDLKSGAIPKTVGPQTAAYQQACTEKPKRRLCVQLLGGPTGLYKIKLCDNSTDFSLFTSCLNLWNHFHAIDQRADRTAVA
jgi:hypothetical protein